MICRRIAFALTLLLLVGLSSAFNITSSRGVSYASNIAASQCLRVNLSVKEGETDAAMGGVRSTDYIFTNKSSVACTLDGYPRVELLNREGRVAGRAVTREQLTGEDQKTPPHLVTLEPGKTAWFRLFYNAGGAGAPKPCPTYRLKITAPGTTRAFVFRAFQRCLKTDFQVSPVRSGAPRT